MKIKKWTDDNGFHRARLLRDQDDDQDAEAIGLPLEPPDVQYLDWKAIARDLHNGLMARGVLTQQDVLRQQDGVTSAILFAVRRRVLALFRGNLEV